MEKIKNICVFCGSKIGVQQAYSDAAIALGKEMVKRDIGLVYGGASVGIMGLIADTILEAGGRAVGVIPLWLMQMEVAHKSLNDLIVTDDMHTRKAKMGELSDAFVTLPGGLGTMEELFEVLTWAQLKIHSKPVGLLNVTGYYDKLLTFLDDGVTGGYIHPEHKDILKVANEPTSLLDLIGFAEYG